MRYLSGSEPAADGTNEPVMDDEFGSRPKARFHLGEDAEVQMKTFDLTFRGEALPGHVVGQVKENLARLFCIDEAAVIDALFSGETVHLRCDLDRKTAASYFREITEMGGKAYLVSSRERLRDSEASHAILKQQKCRPARIVHTGMAAASDAPEEEAQARAADQIWAVSSSKRAKGPGAQAASKHSDSKKSGGSTKGKGGARTACQGDAPANGQSRCSDPAVSLELTRANLILTSTGKELARLESKAAETRAESIREISQLRQHHARQEREIAEETEKILKARAEAESKAEEDIEALWAEEQRIREAAQAELEAMLEQHMDAKTEREQALEQLQQREEGEKSTQAQNTAQLEEQLQQLRAEAEAEIQRLEQQLRDVKASAEADAAELAQQIEASRNSVADEVQNLRRQREELTARQATEEQALLAEQDEVQRRITEETDALRIKQEEIRCHLQRELDELDDRERKIQSSNTDREVDMEEACAQLRERTEEALAELRELEKVLKQRQDKALAELRGHARHSEPSPQSGQSLGS